MVAAFLPLLIGVPRTTAVRTKYGAVVDTEQRRSTLADGAYVLYTDRAVGVCGTRSFVIRSRLRRFSKNAEKFRGRSGRAGGRRSLHPGYAYAGCTQPANPLLANRFSNGTRGGKNF